jgi:hypothetical protein
VARSAGSMTSSIRELGSCRLSGNVSRPNGLRRTTRVSIWLMTLPVVFSRTPSSASSPPGPPSVIIPQPATWPAVPLGPYASSLTVTTRLSAALVAVAHSPVPIAIRCPFSVNRTSAASGSRPGSPAASAA